MTDGRSARWTAAALAAPVVAGVFAGATAWAIGVDPLHPGGALDSAAKPAAPSPATADDDPAIVALRAKLAREQATVDRLTAKVAAVRAKAAALAKANGAAAGGATGGVATRSSGTTSAARTSSTARGGSTSHAAAAPAPAPAPTTQGSTGASGTG